MCFIRRWACFEEPSDKKVFIENIFRRRRADLSRLRIIRGKESEAEAGAIFLLPRGAATPVQETVAWPEPKKLDLTKPFIFGSEAVEDPCPDFPLPTYVELLRSNPNLRGHIVIFPLSRRYQRETAAQWIKELTEKDKVPRNPLRVFFGKQSSLEYVEFWIVPVRSK